MHTHPPVRPSGSIRGNRMSTNQRGHRMPRSTPGHALEPFLASPYQPSSHCMPPLPGFGTPMVDSSITTGTIPASQLSPVAADTDPHQRFLGQPPPYYYNSPVLDSTSRSSSISTMSNTYTASCGSNYVTLTDDGTTSIPGTPYASHNVSTSSEFSHAYPRMPSNSLSQSETLGASQGNERDVGYKIIIRKLPPGMTSQKLSELIQKEMPEYEYGQHEKPKRGENNKWSVTFLKEQVGIRAAARLAGVEFEGIKLQVIPDTRAAARRHTNSSGSTSGASSSSTTRGPVIVDGSLQD